MLRQFVHGEFNLNVVIENNDPLFFGKEVAEILGYANTDGAIRRHVDVEDKLEFKDLQRGLADDGSFFQYQPHRILINEPGFYSLVFSSQLPQAREFKKWVFREVLPQIRRTGSYSLDNGLLKLQDISEQDIKNMSDSQKKEFKRELKKFQELLKDPELQRRGHNGGIVLWRKIKAKEEELEELRKKVEDVMSILGQ